MNNVIVSQRLTSCAVIPIVQASSETEVQQLSKRDDGLPPSTQLRPELQLRSPHQSTGESQ